VVVPLFLIIGVIAARAEGSQSLSQLGGMALRAPVLAALFLIVTFATLAMPGSANFVGELLVLFGSFEDKLVYGLVASMGVILAAVYMIRLFQRTMHGRKGPGVESRDVRGAELAAIVPLVAVIVALGVYPNFVVQRTERATVERIAGARAVADELARAEAADERRAARLRVAERSP
jgi:NADH-quinone oxidoreductase subunit M